MAAALLAEPPHGTIPGSLAACHRCILDPLFRRAQVGEAARVVPIDKLGVVLVAPFGVIFLGERLSLLNSLGIGMIALGAVLVALGA